MNHANKIKKLSTKSEKLEYLNDVKEDLMFDNYNGKSKAAILEINQLIKEVKESN
jgi:hypothetical protein